MNLLNKLRKRFRLQGFAQHFIIFPTECNKFNNTGEQIVLKLFFNRVFGMKNVKIVPYIDAVVGGIKYHY